MQGSWTGVAVALAGGLLFTIGSMSHDRTTAGQDSKAPLTLAAAGIAAALSRVFYDRAVIGVFGKHLPQLTIVEHELPVCWLPACMRHHMLSINVSLAPPKIVCFKDVGESAIDHTDTPGRTYCLI